MPFPGGQRASVPLATAVRGTWITSSLLALRERSLFDAYLRHLPPEHHAAVLSSVPGVWLPVAVAEAHYAACDRLALPPTEAFEMGYAVSKRVHASTVGLMLRLAKGAGVTPWSLLPRLPDLWGRIWTGGGLELRRLGPKDARLGIAGWTLARSSYCRAAARGIVTAMVEVFCAKAFVHEMPEHAGPMTLAYRIAWA